MSRANDAASQPMCTTRGTSAAASSSITSRPAPARGGSSTATSAPSRCAGQCPPHRIGDHTDLREIGQRGSRRPRRRPRAVDADHPSGLPHRVAEHRGENPYAAVEIPGGHARARLSPVADQFAVGPRRVAVGLPEGRHRYLPAVPAGALHALVAALDHFGRVSSAVAHRACHMPLTVVVDDDVQVRAGRPLGASQAVDHPGRQLTAVEIGDQLVAVVAMKTGAAVSADVEPDPGSPTGRADWPTAVATIPLPLVIAKAGKLIGHHFGFERPRRVRLDESQIAAPGTVHPRDRAQRRACGRLTARSPRRPRRASTNPGLR